MLYHIRELFLIKPANFLFRKEIWYPFYSVEPAPGTRRIKLFILIWVPFSLLWLVKGRSKGSQDEKQAPEKAYFLTREKKVLFQSTTRAWDEDEHIQEATAAEQIGGCRKVASEKSCAFSN